MIAVLTPVLAALGIVAAMAAENFSYRTVSEAELVKQLDQDLVKLRTGPESSRRLTDEARLTFFMGFWTPQRERKIQILEQGMALAARARDLEKQAAPAYSNDVSAEYKRATVWWVANAGDYAAAKHNVPSLKTVREMETALLELKKHDPTYEEGTPDRALGRVYDLAPGTVSIGSKKKAQKHFEEALKISPEHPGTLIFFADYWRAKKDLGRAQDLLTVATEKLKRMEPSYENRYWLDHAARVRSKMTAPRTDG